MDPERPGIAPDAPQIRNTKTPVYGVVTNCFPFVSITVACSVLIHCNAACVVFVCIRHRVYIINKSIALRSVFPEHKPGVANGPQS